MRFELPWLLWAGPILGLLLGAMAAWAAARRIRASTAWSAGLAPLARRGRVSSIVLLGLAGLFAGVAAAGPRGGRMEQTDAGRGLNVLIAVDVSKSMLAEDASPNRLDRAILEATRLVQDLPNDRIGVVAFAGQAYLLSPLTLDHAAVGLYLETLDPDLASAGGTMMEPLFRVATQVLTGSREGGDRVMVLFTDGEGHDSLDRSLEAVRELRGEGIRLIVAGQGGLEPVRIPIRDASGSVTEYKKDETGRPVLTMRRDEVLQALAVAADGVVVPADLPDQAGAIRDQLGALSRRPLRERRLADLAPLAWIGGLIAAALLGAQTASRRGAALAGLAIIAAAGTLGGQEVPRGERLLQRGQPRQAAVAFREDALAGRGGDTAWYNAGTALMEAGDLDGARDLLMRATRSLDPGLRYRAYYNLGLVNLQQSRTDTAGRAARRTEAIAQFKQALLLEPRSQDAKWNLELLTQRTPPPQPRPQPQSQQQQQQPAGGISPNQAEAILSSVEQNESATRQNVVRRQRLRSSASTKDW
jgi:Ca-activated chloride channel family protein